MKRWLLLFGVLLSVSLFGQHAFLEQSVIDKLKESTDSELIPVFLILEDAVDVIGLENDFKANEVPLTRRGQIVIEALMARADATQPAVVNFIKNSGMAHGDITRFWIANAIAVEASPGLIEALALRNDIAYIEQDMPQYSLIKPEKGSDIVKSEGGPESGLVAIGAPEMWAMGYTGHGRKALTFDTGIWPDHPAIKNKFLGNRMPYASTWFGYDSPTPVDKSSSHGTHVTGIMLGLDSAYNDTIGVAPGAYFIATDPIVSNLALVKPLSQLMLAYEWAMNPDGDVTTTDDMPDVINNSWGRDNTIVDQDWVVCSEMVINVLNAVQAAGIANVFSAGNEGPNAQTIGIPHNINTGLVNSFTVGAVNGNLASLPIANFSSRGPSLCGGEGSLLIKPEVVAPGVNVRSAVGNAGEYDIFSGTSMASPHVSGAVLLLKEAFPYLSGEDLLLALYYTATDLGMPGEDNTYGMGMINVKAAFDYLAEENEPVPPMVKERDLEIVSIDEPTPGVHCPTTSITPVITIRNNGINDETGITVYVQLNGEEMTTYINDDIVIPAGEDVQISLPEINNIDVLYDEQIDMELYVFLNPLENEYDLNNNHHIVRWKKFSYSSDYSFTDFEDGIPENWVIHNPDAGITWDTLTNVLQADGTYGTVAWMNFPNYNPVESQKDYMYTDLTAYAVDTYDYFLSFDVFYRRKTSNVLLKDTLAVYLATCPMYESESGIEPIFLEIFKQGGDDLETTTAGPSGSLPQSTDEWKHVEIPLYLEEIFDSSSIPLFYFVFEATNRRGNHLLIDNIKLDNTVGVNSINYAPQINLFPNPALGKFTLVVPNHEPGQEMAIFDIYGRKVMSQKIQSSNNMYNVNHLARGVYLVNVAWKNGMVSTRRLVIQ